MKCPQTATPGVREIFLINSSDLPRSVFLDGIIGRPVAIFGKPQKIEFFGVPEFSVLTERSGGATTQTASLKFKSLAEIPSSGVAFVVKTLTDKTLLVGSLEPPYVRVKKSYTSGSPDGDSAAISYEITHKAIRTALDCIV